MTVKATISLRPMEAELVAQFAEIEGLSESRALRELIREGLAVRGFELPPEEEPKRKRGRRGGGHGGKSRSKARR